MIMQQKKKKIALVYSSISRLTSKLESVFGLTQLKCPPWCKQLDLIMTSTRRNCSVGYMLCEELLIILFQLQITCYNLHSVKESGNSIPNVWWFINLPWPSYHLWNQYFLTFAKFVHQNARQLLYLYFNI